MHPLLVAIIILISWTIGCASFTRNVAVLFDDKLYFEGYDTIDLQRIFYLDLSQSFSIYSPAYVKNNISLTNPVVNYPAFGSGKNGTIYLFGGMSMMSGGGMGMGMGGAMSLSTYAIAVTPDGRNATWKEIPTVGSPPPSCYRIQGIIDDSEQLYIWGGYPSSGFTTPSYTMYKLDLSTSPSTWKSNQQPHGPPLAYDFSATLLPDGRIVYIGGRLFDGSCANISQVWTYDTKGMEWKLNPTQGPPISDRSQHSTVLASDGHSIIVLGGNASDSQGVAPDQILIVLDTRNFTWSIPVIGSGTPPTTVLTTHTAIMHNDYMIVTLQDNTMYILDTMDGRYNWVSNYVARRQSGAPTIDNDSPTGSLPPVGVLPKTPNHLIGIIIGPAAIILISSTVAYCFCHRKRDPRGRRFNKRLSSHPRDSGTHEVKTPEKGNDEEKLDTNEMSEIPI